MSYPSPPDPVVLIAGPTLRPEVYRCPNCRAIEPYASALPALGVTCRRCSARISSGDVVVYASIGPRLLALFVDSLVVGVPTIALILFVGWVSTAYAPKDEHGRVTQPAAFWITVSFIAIALTILIGYLSIGNARGRTVGKRATGLNVVLLDTGEAPGITRSLVRTPAQLLTIVTLGVGYAISIFDERRCTLHDRIARTIVVER